MIEHDGDCEGIGGGGRLDACNGKHGVAGENDIGRREREGTRVFKEGERKLSAAAGIAQHLKIINAVEALGLQHQVAAALVTAEGDHWVGPP